MLENRAQEDLELVAVPYTQGRFMSTAVLMNSQPVGLRRTPWSG